MITTLRLQQFRNYRDESFEFESGVNILVGPNGSGKTNLLEALFVLATGNSYRVSDQDLIQFDADWARLDAFHVNQWKQSVHRVIKLIANPTPSKIYEFDEKPYKRLTDTHRIPLVLFEPNHLQLLHGSPEARRNYLDDILEQTQPNYRTYRKNYKRVLAQRNALLKRSKRPSHPELFPWDLRLSELGAVLARARATLTSELQATLPALYGALSQASTVASCAYLPQFAIEGYESELMRTLESGYRRDIERGFTAYGPHREDFSVQLDAHDAQETASRGETRTAVLALKIAELQLLETAHQTTPLLLLDDVFSELDGSRRRALTSYLERYQTFLTTTDADVVVKHFTNTHIIPITKPEG